MYVKNNFDDLKSLKTMNNDINIINYEITRK